MQVNVAREIAALRKMTMKELRNHYAEAFGEQTRSGNKLWVVKRIVWRLQANAEGDLSERARRRAADLANDADLRLSPHKPKAAPSEQERTRIAPFPGGREDRLPPPGSVICRDYKGDKLRVTVLTDGFEFEGERYKSLSAVAKAVTGQHCNGFLFFKLQKAVAS
jgi:DUF2924 family protein